MKTRQKIRVGSDFSGVGAFDQALRRLNINYETVFSCDMDKYARQTYIHNYGEPQYYPENVYDREIPKEPIDIYMTSPPCQAFSLAGKRKGESDKRGILFYNSHEFIQKNKPRYFIFENVKGLLSDDNGKTFQNWIDMLGGKTVNGNPVIFPHEDSTPYHIYYKVLNAKHFGVPQNRERIFIIGIREDADNNFRFPKPFPLIKRLKSVLQKNVDEKYYLSKKLISGFLAHTEKHIEKGTGFTWNPKNENDIANALRANAALCPPDNSIKINPFQKTQIAAMRGRNPENPGDRTTGAHTEQRLEINSQGISNTLTSVQKDNLVLKENNIRRLTPRECFRLMDFPDSFSWPVSDSQAYKQAGNSIVVNVLAQIINNLEL
jgi:DNA (cytosine-5)-methyltransferase 1